VHLHLRLATVVLSFALGVAIACAGSSQPAVRGESSHVTPPAAGGGDRSAVARTATAMIGAPYRYGGSSPRGFDCSGLVVYSYAQAGRSGLPRSASALERRARPIALSELRPGDLLFFHLEGKKASHVAIYVGDRSFVHAPSSGKRVEKVHFDHVYWGPRLALAGRLEF
jgi:cell wall-associated NlpC family hydrolase